LLASGSSRCLLCCQPIYMKAIWWPIIHSTPLGYRTPTNMQKLRMIVHSGNRCFVQKKLN
uniref:Ovule protein n=1 Tax=Gongylonema pulchrum TaxID=637853 RepID=A0A183D4G8_9BILA